MIAGSTAAARCLQSRTGRTGFWPLGGLVAPRLRRARRYVSCPGQLQRLLSGKEPLWRKISLPHPGARCAPMLDPSLGGKLPKHVYNFPLVTDIDDVQVVYPVIEGRPHGSCSLVSI